MTATSESVSKEGDGCLRFAPAYRAGNDFFQSLSQKDANEAKAARCGKSNGMENLGISDRVSYP